LCKDVGVCQHHHHRREDVLVFVKGGSENRPALKQLSNELYSKTHASLGLTDFYYGFTPYTGTHEYDYCQITFEVKGTAAQLAFLNIVDGKFEILRVDPEDAAAEREAIASWAQDHQQRSLPKEVDRQERKAENPMIQALKHSDWNVRADAVSALGQAEDPEAVEPLIAVLKDEQSTVRYLAARYLGDLGDRRAVKPLIKLFKDTNYTAREQAAYAVGRILAGTCEPDRKLSASAVKPLIRLLSDEEVDVRAAAAESLERLGDPKAVEPLIKALKDESGRVRSAAADALGAIGDARARAALIEATEDEEERVRKYATKALRRIDGPAD
jgi:HEAT repeat protein